MGYLRRNRGLSKQADERRPYLEEAKAEEDIFIRPGNGRYYLLSREFNLVRSMMRRRIVRNHWPFGICSFPRGFLSKHEASERGRSTSSFGWDGMDGWMIGGVSLRTPLFHRIIIIFLLLPSFLRPTDRHNIGADSDSNRRSALNYATQNDVADF